MTIATTHRLAVQPLTKAEAGFNGVTKRVAEIQDGPQT